MTDNTQTAPALTRKQQKTAAWNAAQRAKSIAQKPPKPPKGRKPPKRTRESDRFLPAIDGGDFDNLGESPDC